MKTFSAVLWSPLLAFLVASLPAFASDDAFHDQYERAQEACIKASYPNSMAKADDPSTHQEQLAAKRDAIAQTFATPEGIKYLVAKAQSSDTREAQVCISQLLAAIAMRRLTTQ